MEADEAVDLLGEVKKFVDVALSSKIDIHEIKILN